MVTCLAVGRAWDAVMLLHGCFRVVIVGLAMVAKHSLSAFCSHVALFSASEACGPFLVSEAFGELL